MAVETRRTALVDLTLDLIQKLIAHQHLAGAVHSISHKRDPAAARAGRKVSILRLQLDLLISEQELWTVLAVIQSSKL